MTNSSTQFKSLLLLIFCSLFFLRSNAQRHEQSDNRGTREPRIQHPTRTYGQTVHPQRNPPIRENHIQPQVHNTGGIRPVPHTQTVVHPVRQSRPPVAAAAHPQSFRHVDRGFRQQVRVAARPGYEFYNNGYRHYSSRPPVYNAHNPCWRYSYLPPRRAIITSFPFQYQTINFGGFGYRFYNGTYYRPYNDAFMVVAPPFGLSISILPFGYRRIFVNQNPYYYYNGTYYDEYENNYRVVAPPVGAVVESIPQGYETIVIDGETYYKVDGVQYKPVVQDSGEIWYQVIKVDQ